MSEILIDSDLIELFLESIIYEKTLKKEELDNKIKEVAVWPGCQVLKTSTTEMLNNLIALYSLFKTHSWTELTNDIYTYLVVFYATHVCNKYYQFNASIQRTSVYVIKGFNYTTTEKGDNHNTALRYLEEALAQHLQEDDDFLGTFLRAVEMIEQEHDEISAFSLISGTMLSATTGEPLSYSQWFEVMQESRVV